ncbi:hypothetical protein DEU52_107135 [Ensifer adhaerens]|nr:hypothetical protein DEU52_107135 [Ensifer adhaerens]
MQLRQHGLGIGPEVGRIDLVGDEQADSVERL